MMVQGIIEGDARGSVTQIGKDLARIEAVAIIRAEEVQILFGPDGNPFGQRVVNLVT